MIKKLKIKFILTVTTMISLMFVTVLSLFYFFVAQNIRSETGEALVSYMSKSSSLLLDERDNKFFGTANNKYSHYNIFILEFYEYSNTIRSYGFNSNESDITDEQKSYLISLVQYVIDSGEKNGTVKDTNLCYYALMQNNNTFLKIVFLDKDYENTTLSALIFNLLLIGAGGILAFFLISLFIAKLAISPVEKSWNQQQQLVADVSHELKTPLAVITSNTEILLSNPDALIKDEKKWLDYIKTEAGRMTGLINNMLYLAKSEETLSRQTKERIQLSDLTYMASLPFESVCFERNLVLECLIQPDLYIMGNAEMYKQLVAILIDNACKYSYPETTITLSLYKEQDRIIFAIKNRGDVINPMQAAHLFERFYRTDKSRSGTEGSYGLGLSIAKTIVESSNAKILLDSSEEKGTTFSCIFKSDS